MHKLRMAAVGVVLVGLTWWAATAVAQGAPATILTEGTQRFSPGASNAECYDLAAGTLMIETTSPPGRTGESAFLAVNSDTTKLVLLRTLVADGPISAQYPIEAGRYCYAIAITHRLTDANTEPANRPDKQVWLRVSYSPQ